MPIANKLWLSKAALAVPDGVLIVIHLVSYSESNVNLEKVKWLKSIVGH